MDQIAALQWVQNNITQFHGDPRNVTLFGESAGGFSVNTLLLSTQTEGLFQKAIIESGSGRHNIVPNQSWSQAEKAGLAFAASHHIIGSDDKALAALRQLPAAKLVNGLNMATMQTPDYSGPMIDGRVITDEPQALYQKGAFNKVPLMVGANEADIGFAPQVKTLEQAVAVFDESLRAKAQRVYAGMAPQQVANAIASDSFMVEPARFLARVWSDNQVPVWQYRPGYVAKSLREQTPAATHASEIPYVFNTLSARYGKEVAAEDLAVAQQLHRYWVNFARNGNPAGKGLPQWSAFERQKDNVMIVPTSGAAYSQVQGDHWHDRLDLVGTLVKE